jgi:hypothetical protein
MKIKYLILTAIIAFSIIACGSDPDDDNDANAAGNENPTHFTGTLEFRGEQVWEPNINATRLSDMYHEFNGSREIIVYVNGPQYSEWITAGLGRIENGTLNFTVDELPAESLRGWDDFKSLFVHWTDVAIDVPETRGNFIAVLTSDGEGLSRENMIEVDSSLAQEIIIFFYVDSDCQITGNNGEGELDNGYYFTEAPLSLSLKKGWNTIYRREAYAQSGKAAILMEIKNPSLKWVLYY